MCWTDATILEEPFETNVVKDKITAPIQGDKYNETSQKQTKPTKANSNKNCYREQNSYCKCETYVEVDLQSLVHMLPSSLSSG